MIAHHPLLAKIPCFKGMVSNQYYVNFLGAHFRRSFGHVSSLARIDHVHTKADGDLVWFHNKKPPCDHQQQEVATYLPRFKSDYFAYAALAHILALQGLEDFYMMDIGSGYGRWLINAACLARHLHQELPCHLIGVEASPIHLQAMKQAFEDNPFPFVDYQALHAALGPCEGMTWFPLHEADDYSQRPYFNWAYEPFDAMRKKPCELQRVPMKGLGDLLAPHDKIDVLFIDVEGSEQYLTTLDPSCLNKKVRYLYVCTSSSSGEAKIKAYFEALQWHMHYDFASCSHVDTPYGPILFRDGLQMWCNPSFQTAS